MEQATMQREVIVGGQQETSLQWEIIVAPDGKPFVALSIYGPENALTLRLNPGTFGDLVRGLEATREELRRMR